MDFNKIRIQLDKNVSEHWPLLITEVLKELF